MLDSSMMLLIAVVMMSSLIAPIGLGRFSHSSQSLLRVLAIEGIFRTHTK